MNERYLFAATSILYLGWSYASWKAGNYPKAWMLLCYAAANVGLFKL